MKSASPALVALLNSGLDFVMADLWTITLSGGAVLRWSGVDIPITTGGNTYALGPVIARSAITEKRGLEVATLEVTIHAGDDDLINGFPIIGFIAKHGFDGAAIRLDRAFAADWNSPIAGTIWRFGGRVTSVGSVQDSTATLTVSSSTILLNVNVPPNLYQAPCLHAVYDGGCGLAQASFAATGTVTASPAPSPSAFDTSLTPAANHFAQGRIVFTSGVNAGLARTVRSNDAGGAFLIIPPLPAPPASGDAFTAYPGCDKTQGTCLTKFNNLSRFKGAPYVPTPETAL